MGNTVTERLAARMAEIKREEAAILRAMGANSRHADTVHDQVAARVPAAEAKVDPGGAKEVALLDSLLTTKEGLLAASQYGDRTVQQFTGKEPRQDASVPAQKPLKKGLWESVLAFFRG